MPGCRKWVEMDGLGPRLRPVFRNTFAGRRFESDTKGEVP